MLFNNTFHNKQTFICKHPQRILNIFYSLYRMITIEPKKTTNRQTQNKYVTLILSRAHPTHEQARKTTIIFSTGAAKKQTLAFNKNQPTALLFFSYIV